MSRNGEGQKLQRALIPFCSLASLVQDKTVNAKAILLQKLFLALISNLQESITLYHVYRTSLTFSTLMATNYHGLIQEIN